VGWLGSRDGDFGSQGLGYGVDAVEGPCENEIVVGGEGGGEACRELAVVD
jgi:hypothetical protein